MSIDTIVQNMNNAFRATSSAQNVVANEASKETPQVSLMSFLTPVKGVASGIFRVLSRTEPSPLGVSIGIGNLFDQKLRVVPGTLSPVQRDFGVMAVTAKLQINEIRKPIYEEEPKGFRCVARNLFMDEKDNSTWKLVENNGSRVLFRNNEVETDEDFEKLLATASNITHRSSNEHKMLCNQLITNASVGTLVSFVDQDHSVGFVVDNRQQGLVGVLPLKGTSVSYVHPSNVVTAYDVQSMNLKIPQLSESAASVSATVRPSIDTIIAFYKRVYGFNAEFFNKFEQDLRSYKYVQ